MNNIITKIKKIAFVVAATSIFMLPQTTYARTSDGRCIYKSCNNVCYGQSVYCIDHDFTYQLSHTPCVASGCKNYTDTGCGSYCGTHWNKLYGGKKNIAYKGGYAPIYNPATGKTEPVTNSSKKSSYSYSSSKKKSSSSSSSKKKINSSYDKGYNDVYDNGDYDDDRYRSDWDYSLGVDDALDDDDWDF